ncbi:MAG: aminopeptidase [Methanobacteriota archaeon]|nr:MAG: aminopeptidase [Euryarchaeota archaeon]
MALEEGAASVLRTSAGLKAGERVLIVADPERMSVGRAFFYAAAALGCDPVLSLIRTREAAGREPPDLLAAALLEADVVLLATVHSLTHTHARRAANRAGARVVSMPGVTEEALEGGALTADHGALQQTMRRLQRRLRAADEVHVATPSGADFTVSTRGREWNFSDTGVAGRKGDVTTLPAGEIFVAPLEETAEGRLVADTFFQEPLHAPATALLAEGYATKVVGAEAAVLEMNRGGKEGRNLGKLGVGLNPRAHATAPLPEAEKALGAIHVVFGDSVPYGGRVSCGVRVDAILTGATIDVDGKPLLEKGRLAP